MNDFYSQTLNRCASRRTGITDALQPVHGLCDACRSTAATREERRGVYYGEHTIDWSGYADDFMLVFESKEELQRALLLLNETFERFHLQINVGKTKTMVVNFKQVDGNQSYPDTVCNLNGNPIENVKKFRYLGNDIQYDQSSTGDAEVDLRIAVAENKFNELFKKLTNRKINLHTRVQIMNSIVRSRLVYSCQTWNINQQPTITHQIILYLYAKKDDQVALKEKLTLMKKRHSTTSSQMMKSFKSAKQKI